MWTAAEENEFAVCQISDWTSGGKIAKRILAWEEMYPETVKGALVDENGNKRPAINCGLFSFVQHSELMNNWYRLSSPAIEKGITLRFPDESCCQTIYWRYPHKIMDQRLNFSCKYGLGPAEEAGVIHGHGGKHCRIDDDGKPLHHAEYWYQAYEEIREWKHIARYIDNDRQLKNNLPKYDAHCLSW